MSTVERLAGAANRLILIRSGDPGRLVTITLAEGETLPAGDLIAEATSDEEVVTLTPVEIDSSGEITVEVELYPEDFEGYGSANWSLVVAVDDGGSDSGSGDDTRYILFSALVQFREIESVVVESTTITTIDGSGS